MSIKSKALGFLVLSMLTGSGHAHSRASGDEVELAALTFCIQRYHSYERQYGYSKSLMNVLPKYTSALEKNRNDEYIQRNFLSHLKQFESWSQKGLSELCDEMYKTAVRDFPLPPNLEKQPGGQTR